MCFLKEREIFFSSNFLATKPNTQVNNLLEAQIGELFFFELQSSRIHVDIENIGRICIIIMKIDACLETIYAQLSFHTYTAYTHKHIQHTLFII